MIAWKAARRLGGVEGQAAQAVNFAHDSLRISREQFVTRHVVFAAVSGVSRVRSNLLGVMLACALGSERSPQLINSVPKGFGRVSKVSEALGCEFPCPKFESIG